jgi:hypothetical protein
VLAPVAALFVLLLWPAAPSGTVVQLAMLDTVGATRGDDTNDVAALRKTWPASTAEVFTTAAQLEEWARNWPDARKAYLVKIIYDKAAGEIRVIGRKDGRRFERTFQVGAGLDSALKMVENYVKEDTVR